MYNLALKNGKNKQEWSKACDDYGTHPIKLIILIKIR
jgi:hypothetical protein